MAKKKKNEVASKDIAIMAARLAEEGNCSDIVVFDLRGISPVTDYFVIATGTSNIQIRAIGTEIAQVAKEKGFHAFGKAGFDQGRWVVLDLVTVVIHIFDREYRDYYGLEMMWGDAAKVQWQEKGEK